MNRRKICQTLTLGAAMLLPQVQLPAQTWQTVLDYQLAPGQIAQGNVLVADAFGNVFAGGYAWDGTKTDHGLVLKTDTTAINWFLGDDTNPSPTQDGSRVWNGLGFDSNGNLYSVGTLTLKCSTSPCPASWQVRKSSDGGASWHTTSLFQYAPGMDSRAEAFASDASGNIYVTGYGTDASGFLHWLVRKSVDGGQSWALADDFHSSAKGGFPKWGIPDKAQFAPGIGLFVAGLSSSDQYGANYMWTVRRSLDGGATWSTDTYQPGGTGYLSAANGVVSDNQGNIYVVGSAEVPQAINHKKYTTGQWIIRKSSDGGITWVSAVVLSAGTGKVANAESVATDSAGNVVVVGRWQDAQNVYHWLVRRPDLLGNWQTVDDFQLVPGQYAEARSITADVGGNLFVAGVADDATGAHWIVRKTNP